jgi:hypothetical protein
MLIDGLQALVHAAVQPPNSTERGSNHGDHANV